MGTPMGGSGHICLRIGEHILRVHDWVMHAPKWPDHVRLMVMRYCSNCPKEVLHGPRPAGGTLGRGPSFLGTKSPCSYISEERERYPLQPCGLATNIASIWS